MCDQQGRPTVEFGVFDHVDRGAEPLHEYYENRMKLIEAYDRLGFRSYHVAEHHYTPLGMAPSPSVYLACVAQRSKRLRFGPLVYIVPLYHPLRLAEEICMLDQISGGRLELGFGRGVSPKEFDFFGTPFADAPDMYAEGVEIILRSLKGERLDFQGRFYKFRDLPPLDIECFQKPHPALWYGAHSPDSAARAARRGLNIVSTDPAPRVRALADAYKAAWREEQGDKPLPRIGLMRFVVVADTDQEAQKIARRAYKTWYAAFDKLITPYGIPNPNPRPPDWDGIPKVSMGIAGSPETVAAFLSAQVRETGVNYIASQFVFGDLSLDETLRSVNLFASQVMPAIRAGSSQSGDTGARAKIETV
jgi:alkanesulfonate monooxygenase SsuD/methylene tetrahydromethanopterin reductase-like flavin-dependent oxidoreductase (luciferase family)